jgi:hypothetical protein
MIFFTKIIESKRNFLILLISMHLLLHLPFIHFPPSYIHTWKQCNTMAVIRNFQEEDMNIFHPRVDGRKNTNGVTGMQFPSYEFIVASVGKIIGFHETTARVVTLIIFAFCLYFFYGLIYFIFQSRFAAAVGAWSLCWCPELYYHSNNALPDILAFTCAVGGFWFFLRWNKEKKNMDMVWTIFFITMAGLTKIPHLLIGFPIAGIVMRDFMEKKYSTKDIILLLICALLTVGISLAWHFYALWLIEVSGLVEFDMKLKTPESWTEVVTIISQNIISDLPELLLNFAGFAFFCVGLFAFFKYKKWKSRWTIAMIFWMVGFIFYHFTNLSHMDVHQYYMIPYFPVLIIMVCIGALFLQEKKLYWIIILLFVLQPVFAVIRIIPARWSGKNVHVPAELYNPDTRATLSSASPNNELCIVGPDETNCVFFYYLHKKGFGFKMKGELFIPVKDTITIDRYIIQGAKYLYTNDSKLCNSKRFAPYIKREVQVTGEFRVFQLRLPAKSKNELLPKTNLAQSNNPVK